MRATNDCIDGLTMSSWPLGVFYGGQKFRRAAYSTRGFLCAHAMGISTGGRNFHRCNLAESIRKSSEFAVMGAMICFHSLGSVNTLKFGHALLYLHLQGERKSECPNTLPKRKIEGWITRCHVATSCVPSVISGRTNAVGTRSRADVHTPLGAKGIGAHDLRKRASQRPTA